MMYRDKQIENSFTNEQAKAMLLSANNIKKITLESGSLANSNNYKRILVFTICWEIF